MTQPSTPEQHVQAAAAEPAAPAAPAAPAKPQRANSPRKEWKAAARGRLKGHYLFFFMLIFVAAMLGTTYAGAIDFVKLPAADIVTGQAVTEPAQPAPESLGQALGQAAQNAATPVKTQAAWGISGVYDSLMRGDVQEGQQITQSAQADQAGTDIQAGGLEIAFRRGILSSVVGNLSSGAALMTAFAGLKSIVGSQSIANALFVLVSVLAFCFVTAVTTQTYETIMARMFLEARTYKSVPPSRLIFLARAKRWLRVSWALFVTALFETLWALTIVGGAIKHFSYKMVPYLLAENPDLGALEAITLSRKMMCGHKWEAFKLELSFIGWNILGGLTLGVTELLFSAMYQQATYAEYYAYVRGCAKERGVPGTDKLEDACLFAPASPQVLAAAYSDIEELQRQLDASVPQQRTGVAGFFANVFGVVLFTTPQDEAYKEWSTLNDHVKAFRLALAGEAYPARLSPLHAKEHRLASGRLQAQRRYSVCSLVIVFFALAIIGWLFEVGMHFVTDGTFVNRGVNHGPWLPIYGTGALVFLLLLNKFRDRPALLFVLAVVAAGTIEYFTHLGLELALGQQWWDYSGYFLNLNGRICAEGLLAFGTGGLAIVYALAPALDNLAARIPRPALVALCVLLVGSFAADVVYSSGHPNMGEGVTDIGKDAALEAAE
ncbi:MAG: DUF975 family protein [Coriobacteriales bacterium]